MENSKEIIQMDITAIRKKIYHRYPFLLIDRIDSIVKNQYILAIKNVTVNEPQFMGHFPHFPVMPGVLIIESMAQVSAVLVCESIGLDINQEPLSGYLTSIDNAKFRKLVVPGDTMIIRSNISKMRANFWKFYAEARVEGELVAEAEFSLIVKK